MNDITTDGESFVFYQSMFDAVEIIPDLETKAQAYKAIALYGLFGIEPDKDAPVMIKIIFIQAKASIDKAKAKYIARINNGKLGGAPKGNKNAKKETTKNNLAQPKTTKNNLKQPKTSENNLKQADDNDNDNVNDNVNDNERLQELSNYLSKNYSKITINKITCDTSKQDFELIKQKISESNYLQSATLSFILENYDKVINDKYKNFDKVADDKDNFMHHNYTKEELNAMYDDPDDIEI